MKKAMEQLESKVTTQVARDAAPAKKQAAAHPLQVSNKAVSREIDTLTSKLNGAARDVVEVLDGLPPDLEKRFNKTEKDVYIKRLHEARGKRLMKAMAKRYEEDRSTRTRVDSYIRLFERLLDTVSEAPRGNELLEACLSSESGIVYMLLAEASGRIDAS
jgi:hypothetical protein